MVITIDGGVATGTTTLAKELALALEIPRVDSGSMYRAITYSVLKQGIDPNDESGCERIAKESKLEMPDGEVLAVNGEIVVEWIDGQRIDRLHTAEVDKRVSAVSGHRGVRNIVNAYQRQFVTRGGAVADGRDTGTVVFPNAELKLFLTCDDKEAARRRSEADGHEVSVEEIRRRNMADRSHKFGALAKAKDAIEIDTTHLTTAEIIEIVLDLISLPADQRPAWIGRPNKSAVIQRR